MSLRIPGLLKATCKMASSLSKSCGRLNLKFLKQLHWFEVVLIVIVMSVHVYAALSAPHNFPSKWFTRDDAYYYFKVAQNISEGRGSSFDGLNLTNGYHPLWMLVCIPIFSLARFDLILPLRIMLLVMAALSSLTSILLFRLLKNQTGIPIAILASTFWGLSLEIHSIITQQGMETGAVALSIVLFLYMLQKTDQKRDLQIRDLIYLGLAGLFVLFSRLDGIYLVLISGVWVVFRKNPIRYLLPADLLLTFFVIVGAFVQRASLKIYLLAFDETAIIMAAIVVIIQTLIFYFTGLYVRPASLSRVQIIIMAIVGVTITTMFSSAIMLTISNFSSYQMPRAVPAIYWLVMTMLTIFSRLTVRAISPWSANRINRSKPFQGFLAGKDHIRLAIEPLGNWIRTGSIYFGIIAAGLLSYMGLNLVIFGTPMPVSGQIKRWWGSLPNDVYGGSAKTVADVFGLDPEYSQSWGLFTKPILSWAEKLASLRWNSDSWYWFLIAALVTVTVILFLSDRRKSFVRVFHTMLIPLFISAELHAFIYGAMAYSAKHEWYWVTQMLCLVLCGALTLAAINDRLIRQERFQQISSMIIAVACLMLAYAYSSELINRMPYQDTHSGEPYMDTLPILEGFTEPGAMIGMTGGGNTGYFITDRTIINMDGLINSYPYFAALKDNRAGDYLAKTGMKYIFANRYIITNSMPYRYQFAPSELIPVPGAPLYGQKELMRYQPIK